MMGFGMWGGLLILLLIVLGIAALSGSFLNHPDGGRDREIGDDPMTILRKRYARGELTRDEFERMRADLN